MGFLGIIKKFTNKKVKEQMREELKDVVHTYNESETKQEGVENASEKIIKAIETHPDMPVAEFLKMLQKEEELASDVVVEATKKILPDIKKDKTVVEIIQDLPSEGIQEIIQDADVSIDTAKKMAAEIADPIIQKQEKERLEEVERKRREEAKRKRNNEIKKELKEKYKTCINIEASNLIEDLKSLQRNNKDTEVYDMIKQVLAMKAAIEWKQKGSTRVPSITKVIPAEQLLKEDFPKLVGSEFEKIKGKVKSQGAVDYQYKKEDLQNLILAEIAKKVAKIYNKVGIIDIPQSTKMKEITEEQEKAFISEIQKYGEESIREDGMQEKMRIQIRGMQNEGLEELKELVEKIPEDERIDYIKAIKTRLQNGKQKLLKPEIETKLAYLREEIRDLDTEDALEILEDAREEIKDRKIERREEKRKQYRSTQQETEGLTH